MKFSAEILVSAIKVSFSKLPFFNICKAIYVTNRAFVTGDNRKAKQAHCDNMMTKKSGGLNDLMNNFLTHYA